MNLKLTSFLKHSVIKDLRKPKVILCNNETPTPTGSVFHYMNRSSDKHGPLPYDFPNLVDSQVYVHHIETYPKDGSTHLRPNKGIAKGLFAEYHRQYSTYSKVFKLQRVLDKVKVPLIINYNMLPALFSTAIKSPLVGQWQRELEWNLKIKTIQELDTNRVQFMTIDLPMVVPPKSFFAHILEQPTASKMKTIKNANTYDIYRLYEWACSDTEYDITGRNLIVVLEDRGNKIFIDAAMLNDLSDKLDNDKAVEHVIELLINKLVSVRVDSVETEVDSDEPVVEVEEIEVAGHDVATVFAAKADAMHAAGTLTPRELSASKTLSTRYKTMESPLGKGTVEDVLIKANSLEALAVPPSTIPDIDSVVDKSLLNNSVSKMNGAYIKDHLEPELIEHIMTLQSNDIAILSMKRDEFSDAGTESIIYSAEVKVTGGGKSTIKIAIPKFNERGEFKSGGVTYRMNHQRIAFPIVKLTPQEVTMTSSMSKIFGRVCRSASTNYDKWLLDHVLDLRVSGELTDVVVENTANTAIDAKIACKEAILRTRFKSFTHKTFKFGDIHKLGGKVVTFKEDNNLYYEDGSFASTVEDALGLGELKKPVPFSELYIKGKHIPVGVLLAYWLGFSKFIKRIGCSYEILEPNTRVVDKTLLVIRLTDCKIAIKYTTPAQELMLAGFNYFKTGLREIQFKDLESKRGYIKVFISRGINKSHEVIYDMIYNSWIDPVTKRVLKSVDQPTEIVKVILYVNDLLLHRQHVKETDGAYMYTRGYSRVNDIVYRELMTGVRAMKANPTVNRKMNINPRAVELAILKCPATVPAESANPLNLISSETRVVYVGVGGRSGVSMVTRHREFHKNDLGILSEAGTDDGKAGTVLNYPVSPNLKNLYGVPDTDGEKTVGSVFSMATSIAPYAMHDEMKRTIFSRIQANSWISSDFRVTMPLRTSAEYIAAHHVDGVYTMVSKLDGVVTKVSDKVIQVTYDDKSKGHMALGDKVGDISGKSILRQITTDRTKGYKFKAGEVLAWDELFFGRDLLEPEQVCLYTGVPSYIAMCETDTTFEDGAAISEASTKRMASNTVYTKYVAVPFNSEMKLNVAVGDHLEHSTILATVAPEGVSLSKDDASFDYLSQMTPKAGIVGDVFQIEVFYCGDVKDMSSGLRKVVKESDAEFLARSEHEDVHPNGYIKTPTFIGKKSLEYNSAVIKIYAKHMDPVKEGDKNSHCNALKHVVGEVYTGLYETKRGTKIDGKFSFEGILRRVVTSPKAIGVFNMAMDMGGKRAVDAYYGK